MVTTIQVEENIKKKLDSLKIHPRESYNELLARLADNYSEDNEGLIETIEILSDPETMRGIAKGVEDLREGRVKSLEEIEKELDSTG